ncbi:MAG: hypothetical protein AB1465_05945 [Patescibacteria group bacterium]
MKNMKLKFIKDFKKESWFIKNKYRAARKQIGEERFIYIINKNIPGCYNRTNKLFVKNLIQYFKDNKKIITSGIAKKSEVIERKWKKYDRRFSEQIPKITGIKWKHKEYRVYLVNSCFWGAIMISIDQTSI